MFLKATYDRNRELIETAVKLHQAGEIVPNTYVVDLDTFEKNVASVVRTAKEYGIELYHMTKQQGRNYLLARAAERQGLGKVVAVDFDEAMVLHKKGIRMGHLGHLVQIPTALVPMALDMKPEVITVYSREKARQISDEAEKRGMVQELLVRVYEKGDNYYPSQIGGIPLDEVCDAITEINSYGGVRVVGLTSFPCVLFDQEKKFPAPLPNAMTVYRTAKLVEDALGLKMKQLNTASFSCCATIPILAKLGTTHMEPGSCLTGNTPLHAIDYSQPEIPAMVYVSEISHTLGDKAYCYGGGFYARSKMKGAFVGSDKDHIGERWYEAIPDPPEVIDYHGTLLIKDQPVPKVGDTVVYAFRSQVFVSRSYVAVVSGIHAGKPEVKGIFNHLGDEVGCPVGSHLMNES